jgi:monoamine oxidase
MNAARLLAERGVAVELFEASERLGGRARTEVHDGIAIELGPEFVHGEPEVVADLARRAKLPLESTTDVRFRRHGNRLIPLEQPWARLGTLLDDAADQPDRSARDYITQAHWTADETFLFTNFVEGYYAAPLHDISIKSVASDLDASGKDPAQQRIRGGYGQIVDWLAAQLASHGVRVHHRSHVRTIDWSRDRVRLDLSVSGIDTSALADRVIVTVSTGVIRQLHFLPSLGEHAAAFSKLPMGSVVKLVLCLREPVWTASRKDRLAFLHGDTAAFPTFWMRTTNGTQHLTAWAGGPHARALAGHTIEQLVELAVAGFSRDSGVPRSRLEAAVEHAHFHDYETDPLTLGAYSYTRVSGSHAAETLATPLRDRLFFAGEATHDVYQGSVAGALASGRRAAEQVLQIAKPANWFIRRVRAG